MLVVAYLLDWWLVCLIVLFCLMGCQFLCDLLLGFSFGVCWLCGRGFSLFGVGWLFACLICWFCVEFCLAFVLLVDLFDCGLLCCCVWFALCWVWLLDGSGFVVFVAVGCCVCSLFLFSCFGFDSCCLHRCVGLWLVVVLFGFLCWCIILIVIWLTYVLLSFVLTIIKDLSFDFGVCFGV